MRTLRYLALVVVAALSQTGNVGTNARDVVLIWNSAALQDIRDSKLGPRLGEALCRPAYERTSGNEEVSAKARPSRFSSGAPPTATIR